MPAFEELGKTSNVSDDLPKATEWKVEFNGELFKRYASKQNTQLEAGQKGMLDKMGVEAVENLKQKQASSLKKVPQEWGWTALFCFVSLGDITCQ